MEREYTVGPAANGCPTLPAREIYRLFDRRALTAWNYSPAPAGVQEKQLTGREGDIPHTAKVAPKRAASILDIFSCVVQGIIPHGGQILLCVSLTGLSPFSIIGANYYCFLLALVALATIQFGLGRTKEEKEGIRMYDENDEVVALK